MCPVMGAVATVWRAPRAGWPLARVGSVELFGQACSASIVSLKTRLPSSRRVALRSSLPLLLSLPVVLRSPFSYLTRFASEFVRASPTGRADDYQPVPAISAFDPGR
jgi:hypothetical protein